MSKKPIRHYRKDFSVHKFWNKLTRFARSAGIKVVYTALLLYYAYQRKETPRWAKTIVLGSLGYFLAPLDALPDLSPFIGYTDDMGILSFGLVTVAAYVNDEVRKRARTQLDRWFTEVDPEELKSVDDQL